MTDSGRTTQPASALPPDEPGLTLSIADPDGPTARLVSVAGST